MILYTNGCSFTAGGGLEPFLNPNNLQNQDDFIKDYVWSKHLGDKLGVEKTINHGRMCGSNHRILRTTFDFLSDTEYDYKDIIVGIQFTTNNRFEYYQSKNNFLSDIYSSDKENLEENWKQVKVGRNEVAIENHEKHILIEETEFTDRFLANYQNSLIQDVYDTLFLLNTMQNILEKFGIKQYFFWTDKNFHMNYTPKTEIFIKKHFPFLLIDYKMGVEYLKDSHPSLEGHKKISEILYYYFFNKNKDNKFNF
jgi:hypothetical protein